jgi:hypothetical protein|nr:MAG TPA: hypothetical protein [Caudoviricetes sp.]
MAKNKIILTSLEDLKAWQEAQKLLQEEGRDGSKDLTEE